MTPVPEECEAKKTQEKSADSKLEEDEADDEEGEAGAKSPVPAPAAVPEIRTYFANTITIRMTHGKRLSKEQTENLVKQMNILDV